MTLFHTESRFAIFWVFANVGKKKNWGGFTFSALEVVMIFSTVIRCGNFYY